MLAACHDDDDDDMLKSSLLPRQLKNLLDELMLLSKK